MKAVLRVIPAVVLVAVLGAGAYMLLSSRPEKPHYRIVLDNAFGLTPGAEIRVAGVKAGKVKTLDVERRTARAIADAEIDQTDFGKLHADATCRVMPQSLIGEYILNCDPGTARR